ncbi:MAG: hypothetical protein HY869_17770 [Chloroflexi bacterium]|nr:hypothetical protein [Chloroflexota bacterium]
MKSRSLTLIILSIVLLTVLSGCGTFVSPPTLTATASSTAVPTSTLKPTSTPTPTQIATETTTPIVEKELQPAYIETIAQPYMDVEINLSIITDESLKSSNPPLHKIYINPRFNNSKGENSKDALAHFAARTFYRLWRSRQNSQTTSDEDFKAYLQLWSLAQKSNDPVDWGKVQIDGIWANDLNDGNGYKPQEYTIWPMYTGDLSQIPSGVRAITEFGVAFVRINKMKNVTMWQDNVYGVGMGTNLDSNKLYVYMGLYGGDSSGGWSITFNLPYSMWWLKTNHGGSYSGYGPGVDMELFKLLNSGHPGDCCYKAALKIDPPTRYESIYNP